MTASTTPIGLAGGEHSLLWYPGATSKELFSVGACGLGWCRNLALYRDLFGFRPVPIPQPTLVYASYYHNLAVDSNNKLYTWGCGTFIEGGMDGVIPALGPEEKEDVGGNPKVVPLENEKDRIKEISGGAYHSIVLVESNKIFTFGAGQLGQLGRPVASTDASGLPVDPNPKPVQGLPPSFEIKHVGSGFYNTFAVGKDGTLWCAGENQNEQCGKGLKNLHKMTRVSEVDQVEQVDGGYCHTLVRTLSGQGLAMGCGDDGQRGDGMTDENDGQKRTRINSIAIPAKVKQVAAGANHSVVLGEDGIAYTFGANDVGQCGIVKVDGDHEVGHPIVTPEPVRLPENEKVQYVSAGYAHTMLTTKNGSIYVFGQNDSGQLGLENAGGRHPHIGTNSACKTYPEGTDDDVIRNPQNQPAMLNLPARV